MTGKGLSRLAIVWFTLTAVVVSIDLVYVLMRPSVIGKPHPLARNPVFAQWEYYATFDKRYGVNDDAFVVVQSICNALEVIMQLAAVGLNTLGKLGAANKLALVVSIMTLYKTVMYAMMEHFDGGKYTKHNSLQDLVLMVMIPSSFWIMIPAYLAVQSWRRLEVASQTLTKGPSKKQK